MESIRKPEFKIQAGEMKTENGKCKPNPNKGELRFSINPDNLLVVEWIDLQETKETEPYAIFENEWEWKKIPTQKGRVYSLESETNDEKLFFWMQNPNIAEDSVNDKIIKNILKTGRLELNEEKSDDKEITGIHNFENKQNNANNVTQQKPVIPNNNQDFIKNLAQNIKIQDKGTHSLFI